MDYIYIIQINEKKRSDHLSIYLTIWYKTLFLRAYKEVVLLLNIQGCLCLYTTIN